MGARETERKTPVSFFFDGGGWSWFTHLKTSFSNLETDLRSLPMASPGLLPRLPLGSTGLEVSVIGFGASPLGSVFSVSGN